jgi:hypothetical protein
LSAYLETQCKRENFTITHFKVTHKDKGVIWGHYNGKGIIVKIPFSKPALEEEKRNAHFLCKDDIIHHKSIICPELYTCGQLNGFDYFVEEQIIGNTLNTILFKVNRNFFHRQVEHVLDELRLDGSDKQHLIGKWYEQIVEDRLAKLFILVDSNKIKNNLSKYFYDHLYGMEYYPGIVHGDFSTNNLLATNRNITGIIDWGNYSLDGISVLNCLNYLDSLHRILNRGKVSFLKVIRLLESKNWPIAEEYELFLNQYDKCGIHPKYHQGIIHLYWLKHVTDQLSYGVIYKAGKVQKLIFNGMEHILKLA